MYLKKYKQLVMFIKKYMIVPGLRYVCK